MNKQAITFLSLFSIILVLSIYYILLPPTDSQTVSDQLSTIESLQNDLNKQREDIISKNNAIIAEETSTTESISQALETINTTKEITEKEKEIIALLKKEGYKEVFVEMKDTNVSITVLKKDGTSLDASQIMNKVLTILDKNYVIQVKFVTD